MLLMTLPTELRLLERPGRQKGQEAATFMTSRCQLVLNSKTDPSIVGSMVV
jgi:hypothetical protein